MVFASVLLTLLIWAPLSSAAERLASGAISTNLYFGIFRYLVLTTETKEPDFAMSTVLNPGRLALTILATALLWFFVILTLRRTRPSARIADRPDPQ